MHVNHLGFSNSEAGDNFEIKRFVWEREIWHKVVFYMKQLLTNKSHACEHLGFSNSEAGDNFEIKRFVWEREIWHKVVFYMK